MSTVVVLGAIVWINATRLEQSDERGRQEQRERENTQRRTRLIIENALDAVVSIDSVGVITGWNPQAQRTFGWAESEALGRPLGAHPRGAGITLQRLRTRYLRAQAGRV